jgi:hypothetical protein
LSTTLGDEHRRLMDVRRRAIRWNASTADQLPPELRETLASMWRRRALAEHRSIGLFATYAIDLAGFGAPAELLSLACRAALDEVRHAEIFTRLAVLYSGEDETPSAGTEPMPDDPSLPLAHQVAREALYLSIAAETFSTVSLAEQHRRATDPTVRDAYGVVLADELHHARMGWTLMDLLLHRDGAAGPTLQGYLKDEIPRCFERLVELTFGDPSSIPEPTLPSELRRLAEGHGYLALQDQYSLYQSTMTDVWVPGFKALGLAIPD